MTESLHSNPLNTTTDIHATAPINHNSNLMTSLLETQTEIELFCNSAIYVHVPSELSASQEEIQVRGKLRIVHKKGHISIEWYPKDINATDLASLYSHDPSEDWEDLLKELNNSNNHNSSSNNHNSNNNNNNNKVTVQNSCNDSGLTSNAFSNGDTREFCLTTVESGNTQETVFVDLQSISRPKHITSSNINNSSSSSNNSNNNNNNNNNKNNNINNNNNKREHHDNFSDSFVNICTAHVTTPINNKNNNTCDNYETNDNDDGIQKNSFIQLDDLISNTMHSKLNSLDATMDTAIEKLGHYSNTDTDAVILDVNQSRGLDPKCVVVDFPIHILYSVKELAKLSNSYFGIRFYLKGSKPTPILYSHSGKQPILFFLQELGKHVQLSRNDEDPTILITDSAMSDSYSPHRSRHSSNHLHNHNDGLLHMAANFIMSPGEKNQLKSAFGGISKIGNFFARTHSEKYKPDYSSPYKNNLTSSLNITNNTNNNINNNNNNNNNNNGNIDNTNGIFANMSVNNADNTENIYNNLIPNNIDYKNNDDLNSSPQNESFTFDIKELLSEVESRQRTTPLNREDWELFTTPDGALTDIKSLMQIIFLGGIEKDLRRVVWRYLLSYCKYEHSEEQRTAWAMQKEEEYVFMRKQWESMSETQVRRNKQYHKAKVLIYKDAVRTDRDLEYFGDEMDRNIETLQSILLTHLMYDFDLGYVQGMSDLLSPILVILDNEIEAFWCFASYMEKLHENFSNTTEILTKKMQIFQSLLYFIDPKFCEYLKQYEVYGFNIFFRWLLVDFKREFSFNDICTLWEVLWTEYLTPDYNLFIALSMLVQLRSKLMQNQNNSDEDNLSEFDNIFRMINDSAGQYDIDKTLILAELLYHKINQCSFIPSDIQNLFPKHKNLITIDNNNNNNSNNNNDNKILDIKELYFD